MDTISLKELQLLEIKESGDYYLLPKEKLNHLISLAKLSKWYELPEEHTITLGHLIKYYRTKASLTQNQLAIDSGLQVCQISRIENNCQTARMATIEKLSKILGTRFREAVVDFLDLSSNLNSIDH